MCGSSNVTAMNKISEVKFSSTMRNLRLLTVWLFAAHHAVIVVAHSYAAQLGFWSEIIDLPVIPVAMANLPDGKILIWSAFDQKDANFVSYGYTWTSIVDPAAPELAVAELVETTNHDRTSVLPDGRVLVNGGSGLRRTSIFDPNIGTDGTWIYADDMNIGRGYQGSTVLEDGSVFTLGGSYVDDRMLSPEYGGVFAPLVQTFYEADYLQWLFTLLVPETRKDAEVWDASTGLWRTLPGVPCEGSLLTDDIRGSFRNDNHMWLFAAPNGKIFHAGPSTMTHWITTAGDGSIEPVMHRGIYDAMNGNAVMYDVGKILVLGGAEDYEYDSPASERAYEIDLTNGDTVEIERVGDLITPRVMVNSAILPNGQVVVVGGARKANYFTEKDAVYTSELYDPATKQFSLLATMQVARVYHSSCVLMKDGRVFAGGGGLCRDCEINRFNAEILTPPYLLTHDGELADRPVIVIATASALPGDIIEVITDRLVQSFALVRLSSSTHSTNNDNRRIPLTVDSSVDTTYSMRLSSNPGISLPGSYFLFAMDANGVPSIATTLSIQVPN